MNTLTKEFVRENSGKSFIITFKKPIVLEVGKRKFKIFEKGKFGFFLNNGHICYVPSNRKVTGFFIPENFIENIETIVEDGLVLDIKKNCEKILSKFHNNLWSPMKDDLNELIKKDSYEGVIIPEYVERMQFRNIKSIFHTKDEGEYVVSRIKDAIENKTPYSWSSDGLKRDYKISVEIGNDNVLRAWFSSEFSGTGNGDYYALINPTTAMYLERD